MNTKIKSARALKAIAREKLLGNYSVAIVTYLVMQFIISGILNIVEKHSGASGFGLIIYYAVYIVLTLLTGVFTVGQYWIYRMILRNVKPGVFEMWNGFKHHPDKAIRINLYLLFLVLLCGIPMYIFLLLFIVTNNMLFMPLIALCFILFMGSAIFFSLQYSQALFLLIDYPDESPKELMKHSKKMMVGHKLQLLYLNLSFAGVLLLVICTFGIGMLWAYPYITATKTMFYEELFAKEPLNSINIAV